MPLEIIKNYSDLKNAGEHTNKQRMQLLEEHAEKLQKKINLDISHLEKLKNKITCFKNKKLDLEHTLSRRIDSS